MTCNSDMQCVPASGAGPSSCAGNADCYSEVEDPVTPEYPEYPPVSYHKACNADKQCLPTL